MVVVDTYSEEQTLRLGEAVGGFLKPGTVVSLSATLGLGKTWLTKGIVKGVANLEYDQVTSPAFNLVHEYSSDDHQFPTVVHIDFYRLDELTANDVQMFEEYLLNGSSVAVVEWGDKFLDQIVSDFLDVSIEMPSGDEKHRRFIFGAIGDREEFRPLLEHLDSKW